MWKNLSPEAAANILEYLIYVKGKGHILERLRLLMDDEEDNEEGKRIDLIYVHFHDEFPQSDYNLLIDYLDWMQNTLLKEMQDE